MIRPVALGDAEAVYKLMCELEECELPRVPFGSIFSEQLSTAHCKAFVYEGVAPGERAARVLGFINMRIEGQLHHAAHRFYERRGMERMHVKFVMPLGYHETVTPSHREAVHDETER